MIKDPIIYRQKNNTEMVTRELTSLDSQLDIQGTYWNSENRLTEFQAFMMQNAQDFAFFGNRPKHDGQFNQKDFGIIEFNQYHKVNDIINEHRQLHRTCYSLSEKDLLYTSTKGIMLFDITNGNKKQILKVNKPRSVDYSKRLGLLSSTTRDRVQLFDACKRKLLLNTPMIIDAESINGTAFLDDMSSLVCYGNSKYIVDFDLVKLTEKQRLPTYENVNQVAYDKEQGLIALALDDNEIEIKSVKDRNDGIRLTGHSLPVSTVEFMNNYQIATGGMDCTTRIWDIRKPVKQLNILDGYATQIGNLCYSKETGVLIVSELFGYVYAYSFSKEENSRRSLKFFSVIGGISLCPSGSSFFGTFCENKQGIGKFDILTKK